MAYYLGRDVAVYITTESDEAQVDAGSNVVSTTGAGDPVDVGSVGTITNIDNQAITADETIITIITTDATTVTATAHASTTTSDGSDSGTFAIEASGSDTMANLTTFLNSHAKLTSTSSGDVTTVTQVLGGTAGDTTITIVDPGDAGLSKVNFDNGYDEPDYVAGTTFADNLDDTPGPTKVPNLTGLDIVISATDEDITYMGKKCVLKAEIKRETTVSLTRKKSDTLWDTVFLGPTAASKGWTGSTAETGQYGARWGVIEGSADSWYVFNGLAAPSNVTDFDGTDVTFGYRVHIVLKDAAGVISVPGCTITGHTVSLNADGTTEEKLEFISNVTPKTGTAFNYDRLAATDM